nr:zinc finger, CCHC-type [Tanacetum cinerariifolium]
MAKEDAFLVDGVGGGLCVDNTDAEIDGRCNTGSNKDKGKELWDSLESKYMTEDSSSKKFVVSNFNNYKKVDSRPVMEQYNKLLRILGQYTQHDLKMDESISVSSIIDKLPPSWKDFKHTLKHGKDDLSLVQLGSHLCIEESLKAQESDKGKGKKVVGPSVNMMEEGGKNKNNKQNKGKKHDFKDNNDGSGSNKKSKLKCWKCDPTLRGIAVVETRRITQVVREKGPRTNPKTKVDAIAWWIDSGATTHVCKDCCWFKTYEPVEDGSVLYMGDGHFAHVYGKGSVVLEFSSRKSITLFNVLYVPKLCKNLISGPVLNKCGYKQVYESDKYILSKSGVFVGFGYYNNGMFMLNLNKVPDDSGSVYVSSSTVVNSSLWHARLGNVHYKKMLEMSKDDLIPAIDENIEKVIVRLSDPKRKTLGEKGIDCIFVGYAEHSKAYSKFDCSGKGVIICLYVDDMLIFGTDQNQVDKTKKFFSSKFSMKDMGEADVILGIKIKRQNKGIVITQSHYIEKILKKFNRAYCSSVSTPMDLVENIMPNTDASWINHVEDSSSTSGWVFLLGESVISWASKKQTCITGSTMESEFIALATV